MISFTLAIPFFADIFKTLWYRDRLINNCTSEEIQVVYHPSAIVEFELSYTIKQDHAGLRITFGLFGIIVYYSRVDTRHWDYELGKWHEYS